MFIDTPRFPETISLDASSNINYSTSTVKALSGRVQKNVNWQYPLHTYDVSFGIRDLNDLETIIDFFHVCEGSAHSFRFKDWADYKSCSVLDEVGATDQFIGTGDGNTTQYQLIKTYSVGLYDKVRKITKPITSTLVVALNGVVTTAYSISDEGLITFNTAPTSGTNITAGYEFDVPCSFESDELSTQLENYDKGEISLMVSEVRL